MEPSEYELRCNRTNELYELVFTPKEEVVQTYDYCPTLQELWDRACEHGD